MCPGGASLQGCRDLSWLCPSSPWHLSLRFPLPSFELPFGFLPCVCGWHCQPLLLFITEGVPRRSVPQGQITEITVRPVAMSPRRKGRGLGRGRPPGLGMGMCCYPPPHARWGDPTLAGTRHWHSLGLQKG